jgi:hypothetical protein
MDGSAIKDLETKIIKALKANDESIGLKKLRKSLTDDKKSFKIAWKALVNEGKVMENNGVALRISKRKHSVTNEINKGDNVDNNNLNEDKDGFESKKIKMKEVEDEINEEEDKGKLQFPDLWRTGEQAWRDSTLPQEYLDYNPDNITRLFVGMSCDCLIV